MSAPSTVEEGVSPLAVGSVAELWSDDVLEAELRAAGLLVSGSGGLGTGDVGGGGGGGGDGGDDWDDDEEWTRRRPSTAVRMAALVGVTLLVLGTAGAWVSVALDAGDPAFAATLVGARSASTVTPAGQVRPVERIELRVTNRSGRQSRASCVVEIDDDGHLSTTTSTVGSMAIGTTTTATVTVPLAGPSDAGSPPMLGWVCGAP